jgi:hypothetical protein
MTMKRSARRSVAPCSPPREALVSLPPVEITGPKY